VAGEYVASTFRTEMRQVGKVAGYTNSESKEMSQNGTDHSEPGTGGREMGANANRKLVLRNTV
jgi:hypothetical protein